jgi:hypothetical protein
MSEAKSLTARSHAYLFGVIAGEVITAYGERGVDAIAKGTVKYGQQRGQRMAQRTVADGFELSALNYIAYGEWSAEPGEMDFTIPSKNPDVQFCIKKCPWYDVWQEHGLLDQYGYLYCQYVDVALAEGYNPSLQFDVLSTRACGGEVCDMRIRRANASAQDEAELADRIKKLGNKAKMPWDYHCAHLFKTMWETVVATFGYDGLASMQKALQAFDEVYGQEAGAAILKLMEIDFNVMQPYIGING